MAADDKLLADVFRKLLADMDQDGYVNWGADSDDYWITVDVRYVGLTRDELAAVERAHEEA